jgi:hypothetical protein
LRGWRFGGRLNADRTGSLRVGRDSFQCRNGVLVFDFFFVFDDLPVKFVHQQVDRSIHVRIFAFDKNVLARQVHIRLYFLSQLFDAQDHVYVDNVIEMPVDSGHLGRNVITYGRRDFEVMARHVQIHLPVSFEEVPTPWRAAPRNLC